MMKRQGLVVTAQSPPGDHGSMFGFHGLLVGFVFFPSSSLMGIVLFPTYFH